ncbi:hypothetical protein V8J88_23620 [Massilia sp. W12]|uniref:hypothetical protein n=1 Tax=Massilia sp. W12 TaxID=3126507 RepID=UPI0030D45003
MNHNIDTHQLCLIVQAVDHEIGRIEQDLSTLSEDESDYADLELSLMDYTNLAGTLKKLYRDAEAGVANLPAYDKIARFYPGTSS